MNDDFNINDYQEKYNKIKYEKMKKKYEEKLKEKTLKKNFKDQIKSIQVDTFTKALVALITVTAVIDLQLSYVLAFLDKIQIAESLSTQICTTIVGVALVYMIRAYFDTRAEHKNAETKDTLKSDIMDKVRDNIENASINENLKTEILQIINKDDENQPPEG